MNKPLFLLLVAPLLLAGCLQLPDSGPGKAPGRPGPPPVDPNLPGALPKQPGKVPATPAGNGEQSQAIPHVANRLAPIAADDVTEANAWDSVRRLQQELEDDANDTSPLAIPTTATKPGPRH